MADDISKILQGRFIVTLDVAPNATVLGCTNNVDPKQLTASYAPVTLESLGGIKIDEIFVQYTGRIRIESEQIDLTELRKLFPWAPATGSIPGSPQTANYRKQAAAKQLRLHPESMADATLDLVFLKAFPDSKLWGGSDKRTKSMHSIEFDIFPDLTTLQSSGVANYFYVGTPPA